VIKLTSAHQLERGIKLRIVGRSERDSYGSVSVKKLIEMSTGDLEVLINRKRNRYFSLSLYLNGKSWAKEVYVLDGYDRRLKGAE
jgi:hypothetical protein